MAEKLHFVTGRLAAPALARTVEPLSAELGFAYHIDVLPITVAALMSPAWIARHIDAGVDAHRVIVPGYCQGDLAPVEAAAGAPVVRGPRDLRGLPSMLGARAAPHALEGYDIEIIAEINHCPALPLAEIVQRAQRLAADGADVIDLGCTPGHTWGGAHEATRALVDLGLRVSIDSLNVREIADAASAGAELVLSVNASNRHAASDWGVEVVVIPDEPDNLASLDQSVESLTRAGVPFRVDPILEPIGLGFAASLQRYAEVRRRYPHAEMMMGIGNLTELTAVDSAGVNLVLLGYCQELAIRSVLTTQVIPWAQSSVRECHLGRRLTHYAVTNQTLPKHLDDNLVMLRDPRVDEPTQRELADLAAAIRDPNYRVFTADGEVHLVGKQLHLHHRDPFIVFKELEEAIAQGRVDRPTSPSHAFYLGYELSKAATALTLGKNYEQDESLDWGLLTEPESSHRLSFGRPKSQAD